MYVQVLGYPRLCNSTLLGITKEISQLNGTKQTQKEITCSSKDCQSVTVNYTVSEIYPLMRYVFIADILDHFNNSKAKDESSFSKYNIFD